MLHTTRTTFNWHKVIGWCDVCVVLRRVGCGSGTVSFIAQGATNGQVEKLESEDGKVRGRQRANWR